jgi:hypothetical protein
MIQLFQGHHKTFANLQGFDAIITKVQSDRGCTAVAIVFFALSSMTGLPRSAASCENGRLSNKEDIACETSARSHVTSEKFAKKCKMMPSRMGVGESYLRKPRHSQRDSVTRFFASGFFHESVFPQPQRIPWQIFPPVSQRCWYNWWQIATGINNTGGKFATVENDNRWQIMGTMIKLLTT